jgi:hypothetical protein
MKLALKKKALIKQASYKLSFDKYRVLLGTDSGCQMLDTGYWMCGN